MHPRLNIYEKQGSLTDYIGGQPPPPRDLTLKGPKHEKGSACA
jgi:hypothetical protein